MALAISAVGYRLLTRWVEHRERCYRLALLKLELFAFSTCLWEKFATGTATRHVAARFGAPGTVLIELGLEVVGVLNLVLLIRLDTNGRIIAAPLTLYGLGLGFASVQLIGTVL